VKSWLSLLLVLIAPVALFAQSDKSAEKSKGGKAAASPTPEASSESKQDNMLKDIPAGQTYYGLRIPNFSPTGKLLMLFDAKAAKRITDRNLDMEDLKIEIHNDDGTTFHVSMAHSVFNLDTRILTSDTPTTISREDFVITGERAEFHLKNKFGRMLGSTKMTINSETVK
jgi:hypothetical protein